MCVCVYIVGELIDCDLIMGVEFSLLKSNVTCAGSNKYLAFENLVWF